MQQYKRIMTVTSEKFIYVRLGRLWGGLGYIRSPLGMHPEDY
jgi:hypothetical protein